MKPGYVYIMTNRRNSVVYVGVTSDLVHRVAEHKAGLGSWFTRQYKCDKLVYFIVGDGIAEAILEEKRIKNRDRQWKDRLISVKNPNWDDLSHSIGVTDAVVNEVKSTRQSQ